MIRIAFFGYENFGWTGGLNYLKNLLQAISLQDEKKIEVIMFVSRLADPKAISPFGPYAKIVQLPGTAIQALFYKITDKLLRSNFHLPYILKKYKVNLVSHSNKDGIPENVRIINWIPDFQHLHLPGFFSQTENTTRDISFDNKIAQADIVVLSSHDALKDFRTFAPTKVSKARVLQFVSAIDPDIYNLTEKDYQLIREKHKLPAKFFYLPNQFWAHKNHITVVKALALLKNRGTEVFVVCTGNMATDEVSENVSSLKKAILENELTNNLLLLGLVAYKEVQLFLRYSVSVINPSLFEGWSSTVEECKSLGKNMVVSDIAVHREQAPLDAVFFEPDNESQLAEILEKNWNNLPGGPDYRLEEEAKKLMPLRLKKFGEHYINILSELV